MTTQNASSTPISYQRSQPLSDSDLRVLGSWMLSIAVQCLLYGVYVTLSVIATCLFLRKGISLHPSRFTSDLSASAKARLALFILSVFMLTFSTISLVLVMNMYLTQLLLLSYEPQHPNKTLELLANQQIVITFMDKMNYPISDGIVIWRAWIMFPDSLLIRSTLACLFLGSCVGIFVDAGLGAASQLQDITDTGSNTRVLIIAVPTIVTNAVATGLVAWKAWQHYQNLKINLRDSSPWTRVQKVLFLLVESGVIYCIFWVVYAAITVQGGTNTNSFQAYSAAMPFISALYPVIIILLVATVEDEHGGMSKSLSQSIQFGTVLSSAIVRADSNISYLP